MILHEHRLLQCDERLQLVFKRVAETHSFAVLCGHRDQAAQDAAYAAGKSKVRWPNGPHNRTPSRAVDVVPVTGKAIAWEDRERMYFFAGFVLATARSIGVRLRFGGDWDGDGEVKDNRFDDLVHFEIL